MKLWNDTARKSAVDQQKQYLDDVEKQRAREAEVLALAAAAAPEKRAEYEAAAIKASSDFSFVCSRAGEFLVLRWHENDAHPLGKAINLTRVKIVDLLPGSPVRSRGYIEWDEFDWRFTDEWPSLGSRLGYTFRGWHSDESYPVPARPARISFVGSDFDMAVPYDKGAAVYASILDAIASSPVAAPAPS